MQSVFSVYTQTLKFDWKSLFPSGFWTQGSEEPAVEAAVSSEWPLGPAWTLQEAALYMLWIVTKIAPQKDSGKKMDYLELIDVLFLFSLHPCFHDLVRRYHWQGERALDRNSGDVGWRVGCHFSFLNNLGQVPGLSFSICKMRGWFSTIVTVPLFVYVCVQRYMHMNLSALSWINVSC